MNVAMIGPSGKFSAARATGQVGEEVGPPAEQARQEEEADERMLPDDQDGIHAAAAIVLGRPRQHAAHDERVQPADEREIAAASAVAQLDDRAENHPIGLHEHRGAKAQMGLVGAEQDLALGARDRGEDVAPAPLDAHSRTSSSRTA